MDEIKHTPGPWNAASSASSVVGWPVVSQQGKPICDILGVPKGFPNEEKHNAEAMANGHLIAAAPDMYEALLTIANVAPGNGDVCELIAEIARKALAKSYK